MTVEVYDGPGVEDYRSSLYSVYVLDPDLGEVAAYCYGVTQTVTLTPAAGHFFQVDDSIEMSWVTFGTDETVQVRVSLVSGDDITSVAIYPSVFAVPYTIAGGVLTVTIGVRQKLWLEINGDRANVLFLFADRLKPAVDETWTTFVSKIDTPSVEGGTIYFGPGVHDLGNAYAMAPNSAAYIDGGAWVIGSFDVHGVDNVTIYGPGVISGEYVSWDEVHAIGDYFQQIQYSTIYGYDPGYGHIGNAVQGVTAVNQTFFFNVAGVCSFTDVKVIAPWHQNCDGFDPEPSDIATKPSLVDHCFAYTGDNCLKVNDWAGNCVATNNLLGNMGSESIHLAYWSRYDWGFRSYIHDNYIVANQHYFNTEELGTEGATIIFCFVDGEEAHPEYGRFHVDIDGVFIDCGGPVNTMLFNFQNKIYPWGTPADAAGQISDFNISNVHIGRVPVYRSRLLGRDIDNTPHDIAFWDVFIAGTRLTNANWSTYVEQNDYPYNITTDTVVVVDPPTADPPVVDPGDPTVEDPTADPGTPMALIVEDGTIVVNADSYISIADATTYHANYGNPTEWSAATTQQRESALRQATAYLDDFYKWKGVRSTIDQPLHWPRYGVIDTDNYQIAATTIPEGLKRATAVAALKVLQGIDLMPDETGNGSTQSSNISVGPITISESYGTNRTSVSTSFVQINRLLRGLIVTTGGTAELSRA